MHENDKFLRAHTSEFTIRVRVLLAHSCDYVFADIRSGDSVQPCEYNSDDCWRLRAARVEEFTKSTFAQKKNVR